MKKHVILYLLSLLATVSYANDTISSHQLKEHVAFLASDSLLGRGWGTEAGHISADYIVEQMENAGIEPWEGHYLHSFEQMNNVSMLVGQNIVGVVKGSDDGYIVLGAHYDHISYRNRKITKEGDSIATDSVVVYNGADDNASGVATIIEIGRMLTANKHKLKRSVILVAFDAEESGLFGSSRFVKNEVVPLDEIEVMMSIDMVGRYAESGSLWMGALASIEGGKELLEPLAVEHDLELVKTNDNTSNRTDTYYFGEKKIPALHVTSGIVGPYHQPEDDIETLDYEGMAKIADYLTASALLLSQAEVLEPSKKFSNWVDHSGVKLFRFGVKGAVGSSRLSFSDEFYDAKACLTFDAGLMTQLRLTRNFSLQPEVLYSTFGSEYNTGKIRTHSITIPLNLVISTEMDTYMGSRLFAMGGMYYRNTFAGKSEGKTMDFENDFYGEEWGYTFGVGLEMASVFVVLEMREGIDSFIRGGQDVRSVSSLFSVGYMF